jgi:hypothetical protein
MRLIPTLLLTALLVVPLTLVSSGGGWRLGMLWLPLVALGVFAAIFTAAVSRRDLRLRVKAERCGGRLCTECEYELTQSADAGVCPECGSTYDIERTIRAWTEWGFRPYDAANPAPPGIYWKLAVLIVVSTGIFLAMTVPWLAAMVRARLEFLATRAAQAQATDGEAKMQAINATAAAMERMAAAAREFIPMTIAGAAVVLSLWAAIALWHRGASRRLRMRGPLDDDARARRGQR